MIKKTKLIILFEHITIINCILLIITNTTYILNIVFIPPEIYFNLIQILC
jgi:hypothetical protein